MYLEDALQEVRILEWNAERKGQTPRLRYMAIDALRSLPDYHRKGGFVADNMSAAAADYFAQTVAAEPYPSDELLDAERAINSLPLRSRRAFAMLVRGLRPVDVARRMGVSPTRVVALRRELRAVA
jgi:DNA-directed RNA polymerase specialized sigma24 family protein